MKQILMILFSFSFAFLNATIINVPAEQPTIQLGITAATNTDTVLVQSGTYVENINYNGKLITVCSLFLTTADASYISSTIIDGDLNGSSVVTFENSEDSTAVLCGFTITNGYREQGGGIICLGASTSPSLMNLIITDNESYYNGGGIYCGLSNPSLKNVIISNNFTLYAGGGLYCTYSNLSLENVTITGNVSNNTGGGIECDNSSPTMKYVSITNNFAEWGGGGISCMYDSNLNLENVTIANNNAYYNHGDGIYCHDSYPTLINSIVWDNPPSNISLASGGVVTATYSDIQGGWTGLGNIDDDPLFTADYQLLVGSPCIDTGDPVSPLDPDGTRVDMGAFYYDQSTGINSPENVTIEIIGTNIYLSWDAVTNATSYKVYSSDDPYAGFEEDLSGSFAGESWSTSIINEKEFYYVIAVQD